MGWSIGFDSNWKRDIGYGVPAICDHPDCAIVINRGLSFVCGGEPYGGEHGCGLYFCDQHLQHKDQEKEDGCWPQLCEKCCVEADPFEPKPDTQEWREWKSADESWAKWREENPELAAAL